MRLVLFLTIVLHGAVLAQSPGSVLSSAQNRYWYDANDLTGTLNNNDGLSSWINKGSNGDAATQGNGGFQPRFRSVGGASMNGFPVIRFDGIDDYLGIPNDADLNSGGPWTERTFTATIRTGSDISSRQVIYEEGGTTRGLNIYISNDSLWIGAWNLANDGAGSPWGFYHLRAEITTNTEYIISMVFSGNGTSTGTIQGYLNGVQFGTINNVGTLYAHGADINLGRSGSSYFETGSGGTGFHFDGDIAEFIMFNGSLNNAERIIVENYLSSKYDIAIANDFHSMDTPGNGEYDHEVLGVGQFTDGSNHTSGTGVGQIGFANPDDLTNNEFMLAGHDNASLNEVITGIPTGYEGRVERIWRVSENSDVGTVSVDFDFSQTSTSGNGFSDFTLLVDGIDTDFSDATIYSPSSINGSILTFDNVSLSDGDRFTLGVVGSLTGNEGPGGVGTDDDNRFWFDAKDLVYDLQDGAQAVLWNNKGGAVDNATQGNGASRPIYGNDDSNQMNGEPVLQFQGDDYLDIADTDELNTGAEQEERSFLVAFRTGADISTRQVIYEEGGTVRGLNIYLFNGELYISGWNQANDGPGSPWGFDFVSAPVSANNSYVVSFIKDGNNAGSGTIEGYLNGSLIGTINNVGILYAHSGDIAIGAMSNDTDFETGNASGDGNYFLGDVAEFIHYNYALNAAQRVVVENYLTARYDVAMSTNDEYTMDDNANGDYDQDVAGIGRVSSAAQHDDAKGPGMIRMYNPIGLDDGEFLLWGHDDGDLCSRADGPAAAPNRLVRTWRVSESGTIDAVTLNVDMYGISYGSISDVRLIVDTDTDFSNATIIAPTASNGSIAEFIYDFSNAEYFTFAMASSFDYTDRRSTTWTGAVSGSWTEPGNWSNFVPDSKTSVVIPSGTPFSPQISDVGNEVFDLTIDNGALFEIAGANDLRLYGDWTNNGSFSENQSLVTIDVGCDQSFITVASSQDFYDLDVTNSQGVVINSHEVRIINSLELLAGTLETGDSLTLFSDASNTARIPEIQPGADITGEIKAMRYIDAGATNWRFLTFPVAGADLEQFDDDFITSGIPGSDYPNWPSASNPWPSFYFYNEDLGVTYNDGFVVPASLNESVGTGQGVWIWCGDTITGTQPFTIDVRGLPNKNTVNFGVTRDAASGDEDQDGWNMVANPYPCTIDWSAAGWTKTNIDDAIHIWNPDNQQYASYVAGVGTNGGSNQVAPFQAFWVHTNAAGPNLEIQENCKVDVDQAFIKASQPVPHIRLQIDHGNLSDETVVRFHGMATDSIDPSFDALRFANNYVPAPHITSVFGNADYAINALAPATGTKSIPLRVTTTYTGLAEITATDVSGAGSCLILEDSYTNTFTDLLQDSVYEFTAYDTTTAPRFILHSHAGVQYETGEPICYGDSAALEVISSGPFLLYGNGLSTQSITGPAQLSNLNAGEYYLQTTGACGVLVDTITIASPDPLNVSANAEGVSCAGCCDGSIMILSSGGTGSHSYLLDSTQVGSTESGLCEGTYALTITDANGCSVDTIVRVGSDVALSTSSIDVGSVGVYPNPASDQFNLEVKGIAVTGLSARILDATGREVMRINISEGNNSIQIQELAAGSYTVIVGKERIRLLVRK